MWVQMQLCGSGFQHIFRMLIQLINEENGCADACYLIEIVKCPTHNEVSVIVL